MSFSDQRDKIAGYADERWMVPCKDGLVWLSGGGAINTAEQIAKQKQVTKKDWAATFLDYMGGTVQYEGLYLVPVADLARVKTGQLDAGSYPDRKMISSWSDDASRDKNNPEVVAQKPEFHGLNDCSHFVTQCLAAGDIHMETTWVPALFNSLSARAKMLAKMVTDADAENVVKSGVMKKGDVIVYSAGAEHHHSVIYMGNAQIAMHTRSNHPDQRTFRGNWKVSANAEHPLVTLFHFGDDDAAIPPDSPMFGWWKVLWNGAPFYYYFDKTGRVGWTRQPPANLNLPLSAPGGQGFWFVERTHIGICWTNTGSYETLMIRPPQSDTHMEGKWNGTDNLIADKM